VAENHRLFEYACHEGNYALGGVSCAVHRCWNRNGCNSTVTGPTGRQPAATRHPAAAESQETSRMTRTVAASLVSAAVAFTPMAAWGHHAFGAEFDPNRPLVLKGPVTKVEWVNPHTWIHMEVKRPDGSAEDWMVEGGTPNTLLRHGLNKRSLTPGTTIVVDGYQAKDRSNRANGRNVTLENGEKIFMGSSGTGAPSDGSEPTER
jgi:hypothetical protein